VATGELFLRQKLMPTTLKEIILRDGYIEAIVEGTTNQPPHYYRNVYQQIATACADYSCLQVLLDRRSVEGAAHVLLQDETAQYMAAALPRGIRVALLVAESAPLFHFENVVVNRGVTLRQFMDRDKAVAWLLRK
jgi:hypothetical protein